MYTQRPLSYAPTPYSYTPNPARSASVNLDEVCRLAWRAGPYANTLQEVKLVSSSGERDLYESLAEIYSIIVTLDGLEKAYIKDVVTEAEYTETCTRLLKQYKSSLGDESVSREFVDLETFKRTWDVSTSGRPQHSLISNSSSWNALEQPNDYVSVFPQQSNRHRTVHPQLAVQRPAVHLVVHLAVSFWRRRRTSSPSSMH